MYAHVLVNILSRHRIHICIDMCTCIYMYIHIYMIWYPPPPVIYLFWGIKEAGLHYYTYLAVELQMFIFLLRVLCTAQVHGTNASRRGKLPLEGFRVVQSVFAGLGSRPVATLP